MSEKLTNFCETHLVAGINATDTVITVNDGSRFPTDSFYIVVDSGTAAAEIIWVATRTGNTFTLNSSADRGLKNTANVVHDHGSHVCHTILAHHVEDLILSARAYSLYLQENYK